METVQEFLRKQSHASLVDFKNHFIENRNLEIDCGAPIRGMISKVPEPVLELDTKQYRDLLGNLPLDLLIYSCGDSDHLLEIIDNSFYMESSEDTSTMLMSNGVWRPVTEELIDELRITADDWAYDYRKWLQEMSSYALRDVHLYDGFSFIGAQAITHNRVAFAYKY